MDIQELRKERESNYGEFRDNARLAQALKGIVRINPKFNLMEEHQREAIEQIMNKISRIVCGNPGYKDNWLDIIGYCHCGMGERVEQNTQSLSNVRKAQ